MHLLAKRPRYEPATKVTVNYRDTWRIKKRFRRVMGFYNERDNDQPPLYLPSDIDAYRDIRYMIPLIENTTVRNASPRDVEGNRVTSKLANGEKLLRTNIFIGYDLIRSPTHRIVGYPILDRTVFEPCYISIKVIP